MQSTASFVQLGCLSAWTPAQYHLITHAWAFGFWEHLDMLDAARDIIDRPRPAVPLGMSAEDDVSVRIPRMGVSLNLVLGEWYYTYLAIVAMSSMWTERMLSKLKRRIG